MASSSEVAVYLGDSRDKSTVFQVNNRKYWVDVSSVSVPVTLTDLETLDVRVISRRVSVITLGSRDLKRPNSAL